MESWYAMHCEWISVQSSLPLLPQAAQSLRSGVIWLLWSQVDRKQRGGEVIFWWKQALRCRSSSNAGVIRVLERWRSSRRSNTRRNLKNMSALGLSTCTLAKLGVCSCSVDTLKTTCWQHEDTLKTIWGQLADSLQTTCRQRADSVLTTCRPLEDNLHTTCIQLEHNLKTTWSQLEDNLKISEQKGTKEAVGLLFCLISVLVIREA